MIVVDANILIRAVLGRRVSTLLEDYTARGIRFVAPKLAFDDAERYLPVLLEKRGKSIAEFTGALAYLQQLVEPVDTDLYSAFEAEARDRLRTRDEDDWPVLAAALALGCDIWSEDADFFGAGIAVWTTSRVEIFLKAQASRKHT